MSKFSEQEIRDAYASYEETRVRIDGGELDWDAMAAHLTPDAVFVDPAWGRYDGLEAIVEFMMKSMKGLEEWTFPLEWMAIDGDHLVTGWQNRLPGQRADGTYYQVPGMSRLRYAGDGKFDYEHDLINMVHMIEVMKEAMKETGLRPGPGFQNPPPGIVRLCAWEP
jgi:ketosteroid isomerase-like protein